MSLLLFRAGGAEPRGCPLSLVTRLEDLDATTFESTHRGPVVQYRGKLMPLVHAEGPHALRREGRQPVLVFSQGESVIGLAVDEILDIVEENLDLQLADATPGVLGTAVIKGRSTGIVDIGYYLGQADPYWAEAASTSGRKKVKQKVLLVESHPFFRNMLAPLIMAAGYEVTVAEDAGAASRAMGQGPGFDAVLADSDDLKQLERMDGFTSGKAPLIPLSSRQPDSMSDTYVVPKSDRHALLAALDQAIRMRREAA